jgi:hypothetical protein
MTFAIACIASGLVINAVIAACVLIYSAEA